MYDATTGMDFDTKGQDVSFPEFYMRAVQNNFRSEREGRAVFDNLEYVKIITPGDKRSIPDVAVKDEHRARWPRQYAAFKEGLTEVADGTPLESWPPISANPALIAELKAANIRTVEALAGLSDALLVAVGMGGREWRGKAQTWLRQAADGAPLAEAQARLEAQAAELAVRDRQIADLTAAVERLQTERHNAVA